MHDLVMGQGSFVNKMPGDDAQKFAGVRVFYTYLLTHPGKKLTMMGSEFGQWNEWHYENGLDWYLLGMDNEDGERHRTLKEFVKAANRLYLDQPALWEEDFDWKGFQWLSVDDYQGNCVAFLRKDSHGKPLVVLCNFSPVHREGYRLGVPFPGRYECLLNTDDTRFGGTGLGDKEQLSSDYIPCHGQEQSITVDLPPMSALIFHCARKFPPRRKPAASAEKPSPNTKEESAPAPAAKESKPAARRGRKPAAAKEDAAAETKPAAHRGRKPAAAKEDAAAEAKPAARRGRKPAAAKEDAAAEVKPKRKYTRRKKTEA